MHLVLYSIPQFEIITDHKALEAIDNHPSNKPSPNIKRWQLRLQNYNFIVKYTVKTLNTVRSIYLDTQIKGDDAGQQRRSK